MYLPCLLYTSNSLIGTAPELIRNYTEIRGIGVINVAKLFGMASIKNETAINLVINIVPWSPEQIYDRLGLEDQYMDLLGVKVPAITIPIKPGRNLAIILEIAAMNNRQKDVYKRQRQVRTLPRRTGTAGKAAGGRPER